MSNSSKVEAGCLVCKRKLRSNSAKVIYLYYVPSGRQRGVCNPKCLKTYNDGDNCLDSQD